MAERIDQDHLTRLTAISSIATRVAAIVGLIIALWQVYILVRSATSTLDALKLQAYDKVVGILKEDGDVLRKQSAYLSSSKFMAQEKAFDKALQENGTGQQFYWSEEGQPFSEIAEHYERLGAVLKLRYLEFDVIFEIIPFPDRFWQATANLRQKLRKNWRGKDQELDDLLDNFRWLCRQYESERRNRGYASAEGMKCDS